jgi:nucleoside-diphosphate-sugar epimerase
MRALITGGAGFIGSHLAETLLGRGCSVTVLDDLSTGSVANIRHLKNEPHFNYVIESVMNRGLLAELVDECDVVFHLAAAVGVRLIVESPVRTLHTNVRGTELVLEAATKKKKKVLITSTSEVYGKSNKIPFQEDDDMVIGPPLRGRWSYACSKMMDEFLAIAYYRERQLPLVIVRLFNTVGPRQTGAYGMVLPRFVSQALTGRTITVYGDGKQSRCFGWVGDVVDALIKLAQLDAGEGLVFNIGGEEEVTINRLAEVVKEVTGSHSPVTHVPYEEAYGNNFEDMFRRVPDLTRIRSAIGYMPSKSLREIVRAVTDSLIERKKHEPRVVDLVPAD